MPKKRKTRQQKIQTDHKKQVIHTDEPSVTSSSQNTTQQEQATVTFSLPANQENKQTAPKPVKPRHETITISTSEYDYLANDLMRTALLTGAIVLAELLIRFFIVHQ